MKDLLSHVEGSLLDPHLRTSDAERRLGEWDDLGIRRICTTPHLLQQFDAEEDKRHFFIGAVGFPAGAHTLGTKRMEALECLRLGARAVEVVLTHASLLDGSPGEMEREMTAILKTVPELEVVFTVEISRLPTRSVDLFIRVLKSVKPKGLKLGTGMFGAPPNPGEVRDLRARLPRRIGLTVAVDSPDADRVREYIDSGVRWIQTSAPELLDPDPP